jgi:hypothetical protein
MVLLSIGIVSGIIIGSLISNYINKDNNQVSKVDSNIRVVTDITTKQPMRCKVLNDQKAERFVLLKKGYVICDKRGDYQKVDYVNLTPQQKKDASALSIINR